MFSFQTLVLFIIALIVRTIADITQFKWSNWKYHVGVLWVKRTEQNFPYEFNGNISWQIVLRSNCDKSKYWKILFYPVKPIKG